MIILVACLLLGVVCGRFLFSPQALSSVDIWITIALSVVVFTAGVDVGTKRVVFRKLAEYRAKVLLIPLGTVVGTLLGGLLLGLALKIPPNEAMAVAGGFGYYSLSAGLLTELGGAGLGALAFVTNIFRELFALLIIPLAARLNPYCAIPPGGATSMDTTLGVVARSTNEEITVMAMLHGVLLTALVPLLVPLLYRLH